MQHPRLPSGLRVVGLGPLDCLHGDLRQWHGCARAPDLGPGPLRRSALRGIRAADGAVQQRGLPGALQLERVGQLVPMQPVLRRRAANALPGRAGAGQERRGRMPGTWDGAGGLQHAGLPCGLPVGALERLGGMLSDLRQRRSREGAHEADRGQWREALQRHGQREGGLWAGQLHRHRSHRSGEQHSHASGRGRAGHCGEWERQRQHGASRRQCHCGCRQRHDGRW
mmetsp:Transcript_6118/g.16629  ORF Transcript_6118/g.16629 Transcript_6118/m.16629 type:complete len:226 (-) Transcript_6118:798-1475(-)